jgi:ribosome biogenesis GTPase
MAQMPPVRVTQVHRNGLYARGATLETLIPPGPDATVGDWLLFDAEQPTNSRVLDRKSLIKRRAAGHDRQVQLIAANIDTAFIVTSCNADFNIARLERYIALVLDANVAPVILLTKVDLCDAPQVYFDEAVTISKNVPVVLLDSRGSDPISKLTPWCQPGQTVAFLGSSGVGKSTMTNALCESDSIKTQGMREDDAKGRHTTTRRQLHFVANGCAVLDTPGMRELQLTDVAAGVEELFADLNDLSKQCKFKNCKHETEPACAIQHAVKIGAIDAIRLQRWQKLVAEDLLNSSTIAQRKAKGKSFGRTVKAAVKHKKR